jgi:hypothetical protein
LTVASLLQQLENNEAMLLMYLADELPAEDRDEVERMLAVDAGLLAQLERLQRAYNTFAAAMERQDAASRLPVPESVAVRRVGRVMAQWHARRLASPKEAKPVATLRYPWWAYPLAAAASIVLAFLVWWGNTDRRTTSVPYVKVPYSYGQTSEPAPEAADPATSNELSAELLAEGLRLGEPVVPALDWDERMEVAVGRTDNAFMLLNGSEPGEDGDAGDHDDSSIQ